MVYGDIDVILFLFLCAVWSWWYDPFSRRSLIHDHNTSSIALQSMLSFIASTVRIDDKHCKNKQHKYQFACPIAWLVVTSSICYWKENKIIYTKNKQLILANTLNFCYRSTVFVVKDACAVCCCSKRLLSFPTWVRFQCHLHVRTPRAHIETPSYVEQYRSQPL